MAIFALIVFWALCGIASAVIASSKRRDAAGWFFLGLILGVFGLIIIACMPALSEAEHAAATGAPSPNKVCPRCAEKVKRAALVCRFCGHEFDPAPAEETAATEPVVSASPKPAPDIATMWIVVFGAVAATIMLTFLIGLG